uniref:Uncharacterized protein n=1 Tax=Mycena chlorophos TaxID=658473 RepID=A0ABQ0L6F1_MYCCL|nr:predicted protein [Mycena chlorophos]
MTATTRQRANKIRDEGKDDEAAWEDLDDDETEVEGKDEEVEASLPRSPGPSLSARSSPRARRRRRPIPVEKPKPKFPASPSKKAVVAPKSSATQPIVSAGSVSVSRYVLRYVVGVLGVALNLLRYPLSFLVFCWMLAFILHQISRTMRAAFAPICWVPIVSQSAFCQIGSVQGPQGQQPQWADFPKLVDVQSATLEQLLDESASGSTLALQLKKAEIATVDLVTLVRVSDLKSRDVLGDALRTFVDDAKTAGRSLNKLNAKVSSAVDGVYAVNDYALRTIEGARSAPSNSPTIIQRMLPWPFNSKPPTDLVLGAFEDSMNYLSHTMSNLILEFELNLNNLNKLEEELSVLYELVTREDKSLSTAKEELLAELWSKVGGNKRRLRGYDNHLTLLKGLGEYRKQALAHVVGALQTLTQMSEEIESLRERVAAPELVGSKIPLEVHIQSIQGGLERLQESRRTAKARETDAAKRILGIDM